MKVTYNWLKDFVDIKISPKQLADKLTMAGMEVTSFEEKDNDFIFEIEITSNRPDWLSVVGIAREAAAITGKKLASEPVSRSASLNRLTGRPQGCGLASDSQSHKPANWLTINIQDKKDCPVYTAKVIKGVRVGSSPDWLKKRLELIGCRSINNIVDITNYILFTWGEPLHAFDLDKLVSGLAGEPVSGLEIIVRRADEGEEIVTIDGVKRVLDEDILVIAYNRDHKTGKPANHKAVVWLPIAKATNRQTGKPIAIAGIIGGKETEVTEQTKNILLEAAIFDPVVVRRARQKLGISTDSSYRFERGVDLETVEFAASQAVGLIRDLSDGECVLAKKTVSMKAKKKLIHIDAAVVNKILGVDVPVVKIKKILADLGFRIKSETKHSLVVDVPAYRKDVDSEINLIEEIARIFGYEHIPASLPQINPRINVSVPQDLIPLIKNILVGLGLNEVITYTLVDKNLLKDFSLSSLNPIEILNPLSKEQEILRTTLIPSLCKCVAGNLNQKQGYVNIFEISKRFPGFHETTPCEELVLGIALCGEKSMLLEKGMVKEDLGFLHLKGVLAGLFERLGIKRHNFRMDSADEASICIGEEKIGLMKKLSGGILNNLDIKNKDVFAAEICLEKVFSFVDLKRKFTPLPVYPAVLRDTSLLLKEEIKIEDVFGVIKEKAGYLLRGVEVIDFYKGRQVRAGFKSLTISCLYRSDERTLTEEEVNPLHSSVLDRLVEVFGAQIR